MVKLSKIAQKSHGRRQLWLPLTFALAFGAFGAYLLFVSHAATPVRSSAVWNENNGVITNTNSGLCLGASGTSQLANGTQLSLDNCSLTQQNSNQSWSYYWSDDGTTSTTIQNTYSQCLGTTSSNPSAGSPAQVQACDGVDAAQTWTIDPSDGSIRLSGLCLAVSGDAKTAGSPLVVTDCDGSASAPAGGSTGSSGDSSSGAGNSGQSGDSNNSGSSGTANGNAGNTDITTGGSSGLVLTPNTAGSTAMANGNSTAGSKTGSAASEPLPSSSTKETIGATSIIFALALAGIGFILWVRGKQQRTWEARSAAAPPVFVQTPPLSPPPSSQPFTLPTPRMPDGLAPANANPPPANLALDVPEPPQSQPPAPEPVAAPRHTSPPKPAENRKPPVPDKPGEVVVRIKH